MAVGGRDTVKLLDRRHFVKSFDTRAPTWRKPASSRGFRPVVRRIGYSYLIAELPPDTKLVYANWARMNPTLLDLGIDFGYHQESGPPDAYPVRVTMSWEHAKILAGLLGQNIKAYEEQIREIPEFAEVEDVPDGD